MTITEQDRESILNDLEHLKAKICSFPTAPHNPKKNPIAGDPIEIREGQRIFLDDLTEAPSIFVDKGASFYARALESCGTLVVNGRFIGKNISKLRTLKIGEEGELVLGDKILSIENVCVLGTLRLKVVE